MPDTSSHIKAIAGKPLSVDLSKRTVRAYVSKQTLDEDGEVLLARGADLSRFKNSPTVFINHQYDAKSVLGSASDVMMTDDGIVATTTFASRPPTLPAEQEWLPDTILHYCAEGHIKGWSVGFTIDDARQPSKKDIADYGDNCQRVITRWRMLEYSVAPLQCNGDAVTLDYQGAYAKGMISKALHDGLAAGKAFGKAVGDAPSEPGSLAADASKKIARLVDAVKELEAAEVECGRDDAPVIVPTVQTITLEAPAPVAKAIKATRYIFLESPSDPVTEAAEKAFVRATGKLYL